MVDTSARVEFLHDTDSSVCEAVDRLFADELAVYDAISMELLAGARGEPHQTQLRGLLARPTMVSTTSADYEAAASLYRACRVSGETVRKLIDCLIGAVAIRADAEILHADFDYSVLGRHAEVRLHPDSLG